MPEEGNSMWGFKKNMTIDEAQGMIHSSNTI
jgi:hypothetical protein